MQKDRSLAHINNLFGSTLKYLTWYWKKPDRTTAKAIFFSLVSKKLKLNGQDFCIFIHTLYSRAHTLHSSVFGVLVFHFCFSWPSCWNWCVLFSGQRNCSENIASTNTCVSKGSHRKHKDKTASISVKVYTTKDVLPLEFLSFENPILD